jgi:hypothetical protein
MMRTLDHQAPAEDHMTTDGELQPTLGDDAAKQRRWRPVVAWLLTALAFLFVFFALVAPNQLNLLTFGAFVRIPLEGLIGVALMLVLPEKARRVVAVIAGVVLGVIVIVKVVDMGFYVSLARPFDLVLDWSFFGNGMDYLDETAGHAASIAAVIGAVLVAIAVLVLMTLAVRRLTRLLGRHHTAATRATAAFGALWAVCALFGAQFVAGAPIASTSAATYTYDRTRQVGVSLKDHEEFAAQASVDAFRNTPGSDMLTALRGKDVMLTFVESYGRVAIEDPAISPGVDAVLTAGNDRLRKAGFQARSGFLTSPTSGGGSWLAHSTLQSGLWIDNQQRYENLVASDRLTLTNAFKRATWQTAAVVPGVVRAWPEGKFFGYDRIYADENLGYRGPNFSWATMSDQYALSAFERLEHSKPGHPPLMTELNLVSSHAPWSPIPQLIDWNAVGDGSIFDTMSAPGAPPESILSSNPTKVRSDYGKSVEYSLNALISYVETYGDDNLVLVFLGDHQPAPIVTGDNAGHDVPITIVAHDPAVLDRISSWGWQEGLKPNPQAPVWPMDTFRDRFLTAFGPQVPAPR